MSDTNLEEGKIAETTEVAVEKKNFFKEKMPLVITAAVVTLLVIVYIIMAVCFRNRTMFRTWINGVDCSFKTVDEIKTLLSENIDKYQLDLVTVDGKTETLKGSDVGLRYENIDELDSLCDGQNIFAWPASIFNQNDISIDLKATYDKAAATKLVSGYTFMNKSNMVAPENAKITGYNADKGVEVKNSIYGSTINENELNKVLDNTLLALGDKLDLKEAKCYVEPSLTEDSEQFAKLKEAAEVVGKTRITYADSGKSAGIDGNTAVRWLELNNEGNVVLNDQELKGFVAKLSATFNESHSVPRTFKTSYGAEIGMGSTSYGKTLNEGAEFNRLNADIMAGKTESLTPSMTNFGSPEGGSFNPGGTYVEVNIGKQRLFCYKDGAKIVDTAVITGRVSEGWDTPTGIFSVQSKATNVQLRGPGYGADVVYWMPFFQDYGLHDCTWHNIFGYNIYTVWGSHGCVNIPPAAAATIYNAVSVGTPVIVYQLGQPDPVPPNVTASQYVDDPSKPST